MYFYNKPLYSSTYLQTPAVSVYVKSFYCERHMQEAPLHWAGGVSRIDRTLVMLFIISSFSRFPSTGAARLTGCVTRTLPPAGRSCRLPRTTSAVRQLQTPAVVRLSLFVLVCFHTGNHHKTFAANKKQVLLTVEPKLIVFTRGVCTKWKEAIQKWLRQSNTAE